MARDLDHRGVGAGDLPPRAPRRAPANQRDETALGVALILGFCVLIPWNGAMVKSVSDAVPSIQINATRFALQAVIFAATMTVMARGWPRRPRPLWPLLARGAFMATGSACLYAGYRAMPLADAVAIYFVEPLLVTLLAAAALGERVGWRRLAAIGVGLIGAWIVTGPKFETVGLAALWPLGGAVAFAVTSTFTRRYAALGDAPTMQFYASIIGAGMLWAAMLAASAAGVAEAAPIAPEGADLALLLAIGVMASGTGLLISNAFRVARVSAVAPFAYVELVTAAFVGWIVFREPVAPQTYAGAALILGAGLFVWWRERAAQGRAAPGSGPT